MIIGGAEDKLRKRRILREFVAASGGPEARIAVIPTASSLGPEIVEVYAPLFTRLGASEDRSSPSINSIERKCEPSTSPMSKTRQTFGCETWRAVRTSLTNLSCAAGSSARR